MVLGVAPGNRTSGSALPARSPEPRARGSWSGALSASSLGLLGPMFPGPCGGVHSRSVVRKFRRPWALLSGDSTLVNMGEMMIKGLNNFLVRRQVRRDA